MTMKQKNDQAVKKTIFRCLMTRSTAMGNLRAKQFYGDRTHDFSFETFGQFRLSTLLLWPPKDSLLSLTPQQH